MKIWIEISFDGDDACIETRSLRVEARVSIVKERDSTHLPMPLAWRPSSASKLALLPTTGNVVHARDGGQVRASTTILWGNIPAKAHGFPSVGIRPFGEF